MIGQSIRSPLIDFQLAAGRGNLAEVNRLLKVDAVREHAVNNIAALRCAASGGHLAVVNRLLQIDAISEQAAADHNAALNCAAGEGHLAVVDRLLEIDAVNEQAAIDHNAALLEAAIMGHLAVVNRLLQIDAVREQAAADHNEALRCAAGWGHLAVVDRLLQIDAVSEQAAARHNAALAAAAGAGHLDVVNRLLQIDAVMQNATANHNAALIRAVHNQYNHVAARLRQIPAVAAYEAAHSIGSLHLNNGVYDLAALATDSEGAIAAPAVETRDNFAALKKRYEDKFKATGGRDAILDSLRKYLVAEYLKSPPQYQGKALPLDYDKSLAEEAQALYYENPYHTAWRYLFCRPNPWIDSSSDWIIRTGAGAPHAAISDDAFNTIAYLWLAVSDDSEKRAEGIAEDIKVSFIGIICDAARGHNFDRFKTRDDGGRDRPSCSLGINNRVLQVLRVLEPQSQPLTKDILCEKFKSFVIANNDKNGIFDKIDGLNVEQLEQLSAAMVSKISLTELEQEEKTLLKEIFTVDDGVRKAFFAQCRQEHGETFSYQQARSFDFRGDKFTSYEELAAHLFDKTLDVFYPQLKEKIDHRLQVLKPAPIEIAPLIVSDKQQVSARTPSKTKRLKVALPKEILKRKPEQILDHAGTGKKHLVTFSFASKTKQPVQPVTKVQPATELEPATTSCVKIFKKRISKIYNGIVARL